ncbi:hypothetical protein CGLAUT_10420 [Corynebacterium glaucum]|uniref:hypothetical protein n=1 Tax=Corynebacterium glaucum TaxID=187491 RepID=UPI0025B4F922|nr:hypothetical protein [Corynebacterium glaucum]WJZ08542.1 hypothetical protein CGLAUT_10420 [Corynebacterium glaucum]
MKRSALLAAALCFPAAVTACSSAQQETWQVVAIYAEPDLPGNLPADAAGTVNVRLTDTKDTPTFAGTTPCAEVTGTLSQNDDEQVTAIDTVEFGAITNDDSCIGGARHTHNQLAELLKPGTAIAMAKPSEEELRVVLSPDAVNPPSIWLRRL